MHTAFGTFKAPNISSAPKNGIGAWTEAKFVNAMWNGVDRRLPQVAARPPRQGPAEEEGVARSLSS